LKIFDFGLARELSDKDRDENGLYKMTPMTGAMRYMSPEVGLGKPYNLKADVYSWSMIMWYLMALEPPFGLYTNEMMKDRIMVRGSRPAVYDKWPSDLAALMKRCWDADISERPEFSEIIRIVKNINMNNPEAPLKPQLQISR
jgi:serine/threonine protein kinase